ncbi:hypothetical protein M3923_000656 [Vibrio metschnikovii]|uniref:Uncharacterized protein n=1 Tax=bacterium 19MO03SA05 TaxID=2920620 RepID=A0AAU6VEA6_UNCXX|nr:hypothetical protein [Vibrio metschnikovii]EKO3921898.1 hypothetical protein [Vibrio metschnikovii]
MLQSTALIAVLIDAHGDLSMATDNGKWLMMQELKISFIDKKKRFNNQA